MVNMMENFYLKNKKIYIYGASSAGKRVYCLLEESGNFVEGFIDQRADTIKLFHEKEVLSIEKLAEKYEEKDKIVIIICIRNVFEHTYIANDLFQNGFTAIIYKSKEILNGREDAHLKTIDFAYEELINQGRIPDTAIARTSVNNLNLFRDIAVLEDGEEKTVLIPKQLLFVNTKNGAAWQNINIVTTFPGIFLYEYFEGKSDLVFEQLYDLYINQFSKGIVKEIGILADDSWGNITIQGRQEVYNEMNVKFSVDANFFIRNCPKGKYNIRDKRIEVVSSGKNRISFLLAKGVNFIPLKLSQEDYERYLNINKANIIINYLNKNKIRKTKTLIEHPYFYDFPAMANNYLDMFVIPSIRFIAMKIHEKTGEFGFSQYKIYDALEDDGLVYRFLKRMGFDIGRPKALVSDFEEMLNELFYLSQSSDVIEKEYFSIFLDSITLKQFVEKLTDIVYYCFLCTWDTEDEEILRKHGFYKNKVVFCTIWGGTIVKGILYEREK